MRTPRSLLLSLLAIGCAGEPPSAKPSMERIPSGEARLTWLGVTTWLVEIDDEAWLWDAFFSRPIYGVEGSTDAGMDLLDDILQATGRSRIDGIFVGHSHFDHGVDAGAAALRTGAQVYGTVTTCVLAESQGLPADRCTEVMDGDTVAMGSATLTLVRTPHADAEQFGRHAEWETEADAGGQAASAAPHGGVLAGLLELPGGASLFYQNTLDSLDVDDGSGQDYAQNLARAFTDRSAMVWLGAAQFADSSESLTQYLDALQPRQVIPAHWDGLTPDVRAGLEP
ncbi:MAG TPA: hypothetical protein DFR83_06035, partial [Deltaproteobacteria bacterium]|nr:hypothetical protein [Deltaproteobacteria bacterium]